MFQILLPHKYLIYFVIYLNYWLGYQLWFDCRLYVVFHDMMISKCAPNGRMPFQYYACADCCFKHISCLAIYSFLYPLNICSFIMWLMYKICRCILMLSQIEINPFLAITNNVLYMVKNFVMEDTAFRRAMQILTVKKHIWGLEGFLFQQQELPK